MIMTMSMAIMIMSTIIITTLAGRACPVDTTTSMRRCGSGRR